MPPKKKSSAAAAAASKRKAAAAGNEARRSTRSGGPAAPPSSLGNNGKPSSRKQKAPRRSSLPEEDAGASGAPSRGNGGNAGPSPSRPARDGGGADAGQPKRKPRFVPGASRPAPPPLNVPKVSLKVELSTLGGTWLGRKPLSMAVRADAALWDVRRQIDAHCRLMNNGLVPPEGAKMAVRTVDGRGGGGEGGEGGSAAVEGPLLALEMTDAAGHQTRLASYGLFPCPGGVYMVEMRPTRRMREEEARRARKRSAGGVRGSADDELGGLGALEAGGGAAPRRGRGRPRSANRVLPSSARRASSPPIDQDGKRLKVEDKDSRKRIKWDETETNALVAGVGVDGEGAWASIRRANEELFEANQRTDVDMKDKWRNLKNAYRRDNGFVRGLTRANLDILKRYVDGE